MGHVFWPYPVVELVGSQEAKLQSGLPKADVFQVSSPGNPGCLFVADVWIERRNQHQRIVDVLPNSLRIRFDSFGAMLVERSAAVSEQFDRCEHVMQDHGLIHVQLKVALRTGEGDSVVVTKYLNRDHSHRFALRWIYFPGHDRRAGL